MKLALLTLMVLNCGEMLCQYDGAELKPKWLANHRTLDAYQSGLEKQVKEKFHETSGRGPVVFLRLSNKGAFRDVEMLNSSGDKQLDEKVLGIVRTERYPA